MQSRLVLPVGHGHAGNAQRAAGGACGPLLRDAWPAILGEDLLEAISFKSGWYLCV